MKIPENRAVSNTPALERIPPVTRTGRIDLKLVSNPPENRMKAIAVVPIAFAVSVLSIISL